MNLICPKCKHTWNYTGKKNRAKCSQCNYFINISKYKKEVAKGSSDIAKGSGNVAIQDNILNGNILDALDQAEIDPFIKKK
jgi:protein-arginine kinase activator protein McsA